VISSDRGRWLSPAAGPGNRLAPASELCLRFLAWHARLETSVELTVVRQFVARLPEVDGEAGEIRGAKRGGLQYLGPQHRHAEAIRLALHEQIVGRRAAIDPQLGQALARVFLHRLEQLRA